VYEDFISELKQLHEKWSTPHPLEAEAEANAGMGVGPPEPAVGTDGSGTVHVSIDVDGVGKLVETATWSPAAERVR